MNPRILHLLAIWTFGGCAANEPSSNCKEFCRALDDCGLLPSSLASTTIKDTGKDLREVCTWRCGQSVSDETPCGAAGSFDGEIRWRDPEAATQATCHQVAQCAAALAGDTDTDPLGIARLEVGVVRLDDADYAPCPSVDFDEDCSDSPAVVCEASSEDASSDPACPCNDNAQSRSCVTGDAEPTTVGPRFLDKIGATDVRARVRSLERQSAWFALRRTTLESPVPVETQGGPVQVEVQLEGIFSRDLNEGLDGPYCFVHRSQERFLQAGDLEPVAVLIPQNARTYSEHAVAQYNADAKPAATRGAPILAVCETSRDACLDGLDNDADGAADCADSDCADFCDPAEADATTCRDNLDNDGDGFFDCTDPGCAGECEQSQEECRDGLNNDADPGVDCTDPGCRWLCDRASCTDAEECVEEYDRCELDRTTGADCSDVSDEDGQCDWRCGLETDCTDNVDNDGDQLIDGHDPDCQSDGFSAGE